MRTFGCIRIPDPNVRMSDLAQFDIPNFYSNSCKNCSIIAKVRSCNCYAIKQAVNSAEIHKSVDTCTIDLVVKIFSAHF